MEKQSKMRKGRAAGFIAAAVLLLCAFAGALGFAPQKETAEAVWDNYEVVTTDGIDTGTGTFVGVNIKDSLGSALSISVSANGNTTVGAVTFKLGSGIDQSSSTGILLKVSTPGAGTRQVRIGIEDSDGKVYYAPYTSLINENGDKITMGSANNYASSNTWNANLTGTVYYPWLGMYSFSGSWAAMPASGLTFKKLHFMFDARATNFSVNTPIVFGTIASANVTGSTATVEKVLDTAALTYSVINEDGSKDVNLFDKVSGDKINTFGGLNPSAPTNIAVQSDTATTIARFDFTRAAADLTVNYVCEGCGDHDPGDALQAPTVQTVAFDKPNGTFPYDITQPDIIAGHIYKSADKTLPTGTLAGNDSITLTYEPAALTYYTVTLICEDKAGAEIRTPEVLTFYEDTGVVSYEVEAPFIHGYTYKSTDTDLTGTLTEDIDITLTYELNYNNYDVIKDGNNFVGINMKDSLNGAFSVKISQTATQLTTLGIVTFELGEVNRNYSTGLLLKLSMPNSGTIPGRVIIEDDDGFLYTANIASGASVTGTGSATLVRENGETTEIATSGVSTTFPVDTTGTVYFPWNQWGRWDAAWSVMPANGLTFVRLHLALDMRYIQFFNRNLIVGTIATVNVSGDTVTVDKILDTAKLTYSSTSGTAADVNLADKVSGGIIYSAHNLLASSPYLDGVNTEIPTNIANFEFLRNGGTMVLNFVNGQGDPIAASQTVSIAYGADGPEYSVTPPEIAGYEYFSSDKGLSGLAYEGFELTLTYKVKVYKITLKFVDENGKEIKDSRIEDYPYNKLFEILPDEIAGYTYKSNSASAKLSDGKITGTATRDLTIVITYSKDAPAKNDGCKKSAGAAAALAALIALAGVFLFKKRG